MAATEIRDVESGTRRRRALVLGLGASGVAALKYLRHQGWRVWATDASLDKASVAGADWRAPDEALATLDESEMLVVSPGVPLNTPLINAARKRGIEVLGDVELFARAINRLPVRDSRVPSIVAVTGTNGKSTVARLVEAAAVAAGRMTAAGANLGTPALDLIDPRVEVYVLELSSFQLELTQSLVPHAAVVLNVSADHLDRHGSLAAYASAKARIYERAQTGVFNRDDILVNAMTTEGKRISFGLDAPHFPTDYGVRDGALYRGDRWLMDIEKVPLAGRHNLANVLAAWALATTVGIDDVTIAHAIGGFAPLVHRLTPVGVRAGVRYFDDSKATNASAAIASLAGLSGPQVVIAGGQAKGQDFTALAEVLAVRARAVVLIGVDAQRIAEALDGRVPIVYAGTMEQAVCEAARLARPGDNVVLAPACASLDMFKDYGARGDAFTSAVEALDEP